MNLAENFPINVSAHDGWTAVAPSHMPPGDMTVIGWHGEHEAPVVVFYDTSTSTEPQWSIKADGEALPLRAITHWRHVNRPSEAQLSASVLVMQAPYCTLHMAEEGFVDHVSMRTAALADLLRLMAVDEPKNCMTSLCARLADDLRKAYEDTPRALLLTNQLAEIFFNEQSDQGAGDMLWLCQQINDELRDVLSSMARKAEGAQA